VTEDTINETQRLLVRYWAVKVAWLRAAHEARMEGRTIYYIHAVDRSPIPRQRSLL
jgi:hypothetical protein